MKLNIVILPFLIFGLFGYATVTLNRTTDGGKLPIDGHKFIEQVKEDFSPVTPLDYSKLND